MRQLLRKPRSVFCGCLLLLIALRFLSHARIFRPHLPEREHPHEPPAGSTPQELLAGPFLPFPVDDIRTRAELSDGPDLGCSSASGPFCASFGSAKLARIRADGRVAGIGAPTDSSTPNSSSSSRATSGANAAPPGSLPHQHRRTGRLDDDTIAEDEGTREGNTLRLTSRNPQPLDVHQDGRRSSASARAHGVALRSKRRGEQPTDGDEDDDLSEDEEHDEELEYSELDEEESGMFASRVGALHIQGGESASSIGAELWPPGQAREIKSYPSRTRRSLVLHNMRREQVQVLWLDFDGKAMRFATLRPMEKQQLVTFVGHAFSLRDDRTDESFGTVIVLGDHEGLQSGWQREVMVGIDDHSRVSRVRDPLDDDE